MPVTILDLLTGQVVALQQVVATARPIATFEMTAGSFRSLSEIVARPDTLKLFDMTSRSGITYNQALAADGIVAGFIETIRRVGAHTTTTIADITASPRTYVETVQLERKANEARIVIFNPSPVTATIDKASVAVTNTAGSTIPSGALVPLTFGGQRSAVIPAGEAGSSGLPADRLVNYIVSDWVTLPGGMVDRIDGGQGTLLQVRCWSSAGLPRLQTNSGFTTNYDAYWKAQTGVDFKGWYATSDVADDATYNGTTLQTITANIAVQTRGAAPILNLGSGFDSQQQGFGAGTDAAGTAATGYYSSLIGARKQRSGGVLFSQANLGSNGQQGSSGHINLVRYATALGLKACFMEVWSGNDGDTDAAVEAAKTRALGVISQLQAIGCTPILIGSYPRADSTAQFEQTLIALNTWISQRGLPFINPYTSALSDGATPARPKAIYNASASDQTHFNIAGRDVEGALMLPVIGAVAVAQGIVVAP